MTKPKFFKRSKTNHGFKKSEFVDYYGAKCSIQKSSLVEVNAIWFGVEEPVFKMMIPGRGWTNIEIPNPDKHFVLHSGWMHLTQEQVKEMLPTLMHFAKTGELP